MQVVWQTDKPASNHSQFITTGNVPSGSIIRVRIVKTSSVFLRIGNQTFRKHDAGQVLEHKLDSTRKASIDLGGQNFWENAASATQQENGVWLLQWEKSSLEVKILPPDF